MVVPSFFVCPSLSISVQNSLLTRICFTQLKHYGFISWSKSLPTIFNPLFPCLQLTLSISSYFLYFILLIHYFIFIFFHFPYFPISFQYIYIFFFHFIWLDYSIFKWLTYLKIFVSCILLYYPEKDNLVWNWTQVYYPTPSINRISNMWLVYFSFHPSSLCPFPPSLSFVISSAPSFSSTAFPFISLLHHYSLINVHVPAPPRHCTLTGEDRPRECWGEQGRVSNQRLWRGVIWCIGTWRAYPQRPASHTALAFATYTLQSSGL